MGARWFIFSVLLWWVPFCVCLFQFISVASGQRGFTLCDMPGCNCTIRAAPWKIINCSLHEEQIVNFELTDISREALEIYIFGGREITFASKTFSTLPALTLIYINGTRKIVMDKKSFYNINSSSLLIQIQNCDELIIRTGAFEYVQSYVSIEILDINYVTIEPAAFAKLYSSSFKNVKKLTLHERAFDFNNQGPMGRHGPVTVISFDNAVIPQIPREVFLKSLASVSFQNCVIEDIHSEAFKANQISAVTFIGTAVGCIHSNAFTERTLIYDFKISKCNISKLQTKSIIAAIGNFTLSHSTVKDIESKSIITTVAKVEVVGNQIFTFHSSGFVFNNWNKITVDDNIIKYLRAKFIEAPNSPNTEKFSFKGNEIYNLDEGALTVLSQLDERILIFDDNFFNQSCNCSIDKWVDQLTNNTKKTKLIMNTSFCTINRFLSKCFSLPVGIINIQNFTERNCSNFTKCEPYEGKIKVVNTTSKIFLPEDDTEKKTWLIFIVTIVGLFILAIVITFIVLLVRGSRWLKEKGYFRNMHYNNNDLSNEDEGTIVTIDENEKLEIPEELTLEFLQVLSKRLDDPVTHQEASEMIERLYEMFIIDDSYENNNRQEEEAHLYEELGNLNLQIPPPPYEEEKEPSSNGARSILKLMEEKFNMHADDKEVGSNAARPALAGEYSEPSDAAVHLYSELKNKCEKMERKDGKDTLKSNGSATFRPLPDKPNNKDLFLEAGPSTKF